MKNALTLACVLAAAPVAAQPAAPAGAPPTCAVTIARAPDDVRPIVEQWVRAEATCTTALEVRIVPTEGGLYLLARDDHGRVRERVVPDAQSAGVLVASWVAADSSAAPTPFDVRQPPPAAAPMPAPEAIVAADPAAASPAMAPAPVPSSAVDGGPSAAPVIVARAAAPSGATRMLALGGMFAMSGSGGGGIRGELDLKSRKYATFGVAASASTWGTMVYGYSGTGTIDTFDAKVLAYLSANTRRGRWHFRAAVGAGAVYTRASLQQPSSLSYREAEGVFPAGEAALSVGREITDRWQLYAGPIVSLYAQSYEIEDMGPGYSSTSSQARDLEAMFIFGMRHQL